MKPWNWTLLSVLVLSGFASMAAPVAYAQATADVTIKLTDVSQSSGISFVHDHGGSGLGYIVEGMSTGIVTLDYDGDGWTDIYFLNGAALKGSQRDKPLSNALYRNNGDFTFTDVTDQAGVGDLGYSLGAAAADYDGDGNLDLYVNNFGANTLYRNNGDSTFSDVTAKAGVGGGDKVGAGVGFVDVDMDGDLDLYVANYVNFNFENHVPIVISGEQFQAGPQYYEAVADTLYRNDDGVFTDISQESGIASVAGPGMGLVCADFDNDQDPDIYVCNDGQPNFFFQNDGTGKFEEVGLLFGLAYDFNGKANSSMGVDCGDFDRDGWLDIFVTNYQAEMPVLYRNLGDGFFEDATSTARITDRLFPHVNWGTAFVDFDNDADDDIFIACGHFDRIETIDDRTKMKIKNFLLMNVGKSFVDVTDQAGTACQVVESSRGAAFEDFDNDGDIDAIVLNSGAPPTLIRNDSESSNHWVAFDLAQPGKNPQAIGARVTLPETKQMREVLSGRGYQGHFGSRLHFGLGALAQTDGTNTVQVNVRWPDGQSEGFEVEADSIGTLNRGTGSPVAAPQ